MNRDRPTWHKHSTTKKTTLIGICTKRSAPTRVVSPRPKPTDRQDQADHEERQGQREHRRVKDLVVAVEREQAPISPVIA